MNKKVVLKTVKGSHVGSLKCIDPLTQTIALVVMDADTGVTNRSKLVLAMSHAIRSIELADDDDDTGDDDLNRLLSASMYENSDDKAFSDHELRTRKQSVMSWLQRNRIPCDETDDGVLCIAYALTLSPPYTREQCVCGNEMVLHQIQTLLDSMPTEQSSTS